MNFNKDDIIGKIILHPLASGDTIHIIVGRRGYGKCYFEKYLRNLRNLRKLRKSRRRKFK